MKRTALFLSLAVIGMGSALAADPAKINWSKVATTTVPMFYPGQSSYEWLRSDDTRQVVINDDFLEQEPATKVGSRRRALTVPSPTWPAPLAPQHQTSFRSRAHVWDWPAAMAWTTPPSWC